MFLQITPEDIERAARAEEHSSLHTYQTCPIAQALRRTFPDSHKIVASWNFLQAGEQYYCVTLAIEDYMNAWDNGAPTPPRRFRLIPR